MMQMHDDQVSIVCWIRRLFADRHLVATDILLEEDEGIQRAFVSRCQINLKKGWEQPRHTSKQVRSLKFISAA